jgi:protein SCO1
MSDSTPKPPSRQKIIVAVALFSLVVGGVTAMLLSEFSKPATVQKMPDKCTGRAFAEIGGPFSLINQDGVAVTEKTFLGKPSLIYFGFTYCPDVCPLSLQSMALALDAAKSAGGRNIDDIQPILISVDPERDTPASLKSYLTQSGFPPRLTGLTGTPEQVRAAAKAFKVAYTKNVPEGAAAGDYLIDHSSITYLMGRDGKLRTFFVNDPDPQEVGKCIAELSKSGL